MCHKPWNSVVSQLCIHYPYSKIVCLFLGMMHNYAFPISRLISSVQKLMMQVLRVHVLSIQP